jgi:hypothetical protein
MSGAFALHYLSCHILFIPCTLFEEPFFLPSISLERTFQVLFGENRKSMSGDCFSVLVILILHRFDLTLHASLVIIYLYSMFLFFLIKENKLGEKM